MTLPSVVSSRMPLELRMARRQLPPVEAATTADTANAGE